VYTIEEPEYLAGEFEDSLSHKFSWTQEFRTEFQERRRYRDHEMICLNNVDTRIEGPVNYPQKLTEYVPQDSCKADEGSPGGEGAANQVFITFATLLVCVFLAFNLV